MKKFVVMYRVPVDVMKKWREETPEQERKAQDEKLGKEMGEWIGKHKNSIVDMGLPLGKNTRMTMSGAKPETNDLNFYQVIEAESVDDVVAMFKDNPHMQIPDAYLDIMEVPHMRM
ncbi:hypothetical protein C4568_00545 [Candidatus Parcubacteria bacterium]|nr:MAG: hypothetical protein C4568_00545 [Candidatus Parcubacteria bacterium]